MGIFAKPRAARLAAAVLGIVMLLMLPAAVPTNSSGLRPGTTITDDWLIAYGPDIVEQTAAEDLADRLRDEHRLEVDTRRVADDAAADRLPEAAGMIIIGTLADHPLIRTAHRSRSFDLPAAPESYHNQDRSTAGNKIIFVVGRTAKGAMNGTFRLEEDLSARAGRTLNLTGLDDAGSPAFRNRVAGHKQAQSPPPGWTEDQQASYYAHNYLNVVWGEKYGPVLSEATLRKWGLKLALEVRLPPVDQRWLKDPANAEAVYWRDTWSGRKRAVSPFTPLGRKAYADAFRRALHEHPQTAILYTLYGDYSYATDAESRRVSDGSRCDCSQDSTALEIAEILKQTVAGTDVQPAVWMWHLYPRQGDQAFLDELKRRDIAMIYNEAGNGDNWATQPDNFDATALATDPATGRSRYGDGFSVLTSAGGSCESVDPAIGIPLPRVAATKISKLYDAGVANFFLWWGSAEGWVESPNLAVIRELIWEPDAFDPDHPDPFSATDPEPLMARVARQQFGDQWRLGLRYWGLVDHALTRLPILSWNQRLDPFTNPRVYNGGKALTPLTPDGLADRAKFPGYDGWQSSYRFDQAWPRVAAELDRATALADDLDRDDPRFVAARNWLIIYTRLLTSQHNLGRALAVSDRFRGPDGIVGRSDPELRALLEPIVERELINSRRLAEAAQSLPDNGNLYRSSGWAYHGKGDRDADLQLLQAKITSMQRWLDG